MGTGRRRGNGNGVYLSGGVCPKFYSVSCHPFVFVRAGTQNLSLRLLTLNFALCGCGAIHQKKSSDEDKPKKKKKKKTDDDEPPAKKKKKKKKKTDGDEPAPKKKKVNLISQRLSVRWPLCFGASFWFCMWQKTDKKKKKKKKKSE